MIKLLTDQHSPYLQVVFLALGYCFPQNKDSEVFIVDPVPVGINEQGLYKLISDGDNS